MVTVNMVAEFSSDLLWNVATAFAGGPQSSQPLHSGAHTIDVWLLTERYSGLRGRLERTFELCVITGKCFQSVKNYTLYTQRGNHKKEQVFKEDLEDII